VTKVQRTAAIGRKRPKVAASVATVEPPPVRWDYFRVSRENCSGSRLRPGTRHRLAGSAEEWTFGGLDNPSVTSESEFP
jgi:hypothetical protein